MQQRTVEIVKNKAGGKGTIQIERLMNEGQLGDKAKMYAKVTIDPHSSIGVHEHSEDTESYYILSGCGIYTDNDQTYPIKAGDLLFCDVNHCHGLENPTDEPLIFMALILNKKSEANA